MVWEICLFVLPVFTTVCGTLDSDSLILPEPESPEPPVCTSYSQLCNLAYNLTEHYTLHEVNSDQQICHCTGGRTCESAWRGYSNSIVKGFKLAGHDMTVKMSYCSLNQPARVCRKNDEAIIMRGRGAFVFEVVQDFSCRCYRVLYEHRSWREGAYTYIAYSCGKPRCRQNQDPIQKCTMLTYDGTPGQYRMDYSCRCLRNQECMASQLPTQTHRVTWKTCQPSPRFNDLYHEDFRRKRNSED